MAEQRDASPPLDDVNVDEARLAEMEAEKNALEKEATPKAEGEADEAMDDDEAPAAVDARSIYVGNVSTPRWVASEEGVWARKEIA
ncbi:hypothetical protein A1Q1_08007 [Trichosporon asahii var. asahii CBS 2479]|uniref:Uncharacterized protein n=1 Tax=Trichosporon asahii var. asahii (strain ATCC 90039 / CBS 2479 / JCM 2466 / KCTC 7840 / NBRC 103889/ NCYC 2677 / UAMH 7654) TaxID=1186058 RepID=J6F1F9_TRIAS|nr:hypothetical protein A1Q1_08007 [Trichosporon asahii var. asahii CBS 2479]EJT50794.1 hypothetical protein A1Q1_08007 [Trichosporon asahii var. asahii CBS 2479]